MYIVELKKLQTAILASSRFSVARNLLLLFFRSWRRKQNLGVERWISIKKRWHRFWPTRREFMPRFRDERVSGRGRNNSDDRADRLEDIEIVKEIGNALRKPVYFPHNSLSSTRDDQEDNISWKRDWSYVNQRYTCKPMKKLHGQPPTRSPRSESFTESRNRRIKRIKIHTEPFLPVSSPLALYARLLLITLA